MTTEKVQARIDELHNVADRFDHSGGSRRLAQRARDKAAGMETALRLLDGFAGPTPGDLDEFWRSAERCVAGSGCRHDDDAECAGALWSRTRALLSASASGNCSCCGESICEDRAVCEGLSEPGTLAGGGAGS